MPTFKSFNELKKYIEKASRQSMKEVGEELKDIFKEAIQEEVYDAYSPSKYERTYQLRDKMVEITRATGDSVEVSVTHTGDHISYVNGTRFYVPYGLEGGHTWGRGATNIEKVAYQKAERDIPNKYKKEMKARGIPIK